jgi:hypothetical protein
VNDVIDPVTGLPLRYPSSAQEVYARAEEFRRLSPQERFKQIAELMEIGMNMVRTSPRRAEIERRMEAEEAEWKRIQGELFKKYDG